MKKILFMACCISLCLLPISCCHDDDPVTLPEEKPEDKPEEKPEETDPVAGLTYVLTCDKVLTDFVTAEVTYNDLTGEHNEILDKNDWASTTYAICHKTENGTTTYARFEVEENGSVPEPWIVDSYKTVCRWEKEVFFDHLGLVNDCTLKFHRKDGYVIEPDKKYDLSHNFQCSEGFSHPIVDGKTIYNFYYNYDISIGGKSSWFDYEVEDYLDELCSKTFTVSMSIGTDGKITKLSD